MDRLEFLRKKHRELDEEIRRLESLAFGARGSKHDESVAQMKKNKLRFKDEIHELEKLQPPYRE